MHNFYTDLYENLSQIYRRFPDFRLSQCKKSTICILSIKLFYKCLVNVRLLNKNFYTSLVLSSQNVLIDKDYLSNLFNRLNVLFNSNQYLTYVKQEKKLDEYIKTSMWKAQTPSQIRQGPP